MRNPACALAIVATAILVCGCGRVVPVERPAPLLEDEVASATQIARVKIVRSEPVRLGTEPADPICGYRYFARVIESLKGGHKPFAFFAATGKLRPGRDYLVFAHKAASNAEAAVEPLRDLQAFAGHKALACKDIGAEYVVPVSRQVYFEFDPNAAMRFGGGEWLAPRDPKNALGFTWCNNDWPSNARPPTRNILRTRDVEIDNTMLRYVAWSSARQLIRDALSNPSYWLGRVPNPMFRPGSC